MIEFTDSLEHNLGVLDELVMALPLAHRNDARRAANIVERTFEQLKAAHAGSPGAAVGTAWAFFKISQNLVKSGSKTEGGDKLIQLLS